MEIGKASILATIKPIMATVVGAVIFKEKLTWMAAVGIGFVLVSSILIRRNDVRKQ